MDIILLTLALAVLIYLYFKYELNKEEPLKDYNPKPTNWDEYEKELDKAVDFNKIKIQPLDKSDDLIEDKPGLDGEKDENLGNKVEEE